MCSNHLRVAQSGRVHPSDGWGRRIEACHADQYARFVQRLVHRALNAVAVVQFHQRVPSRESQTVRLRSAKPHKRVRLPLSCPIASVCQQDRLPSSKRAIDVRVIAGAPTSRRSSTVQSGRLLSDRLEVRVLPSRPVHGRSTSEALALPAKDAALETVW